MAKVEGLEELKARISALKFETKVQIGQAVEQSAAEVSQSIKAVAPVNDLDPHPGALRDSVHVVNGETPFLKRVVADAVDEKGHQYGLHVEAGYRTPEGKHVSAHPFFYPTWRLMRKRALSRIARAINAAARTSANG